MRYAAAAVLVIAAAPAVADPGAHLHPHDGAGWLVAITAFGVAALVGRPLVARLRQGRRR